MLFHRKTWIWVLLLATLSFLVYAVKGVLLPFFGGFIIAYALTPVVDKMAAWGLSRTAAAALMIFATLLVTLVFFTLAIPFVTTELIKLAQNIPSYGSRLFTAITPFLDKLSEHFGANNVQEIRDGFSEYLGNMLSWGLRFMARALTNTLALANLVSLVFLTPITAFYMLRDWPKMVRAAISLIPKPQTRNLKDLLHSINKNMGAYIRGQMLVCLILALFFMIALSLIGLNFAITIGLISGLLSFVPFVGTAISVTVGLGVALAQQPDWLFLGLVAAIFALGSILENIISPMLIGQSIGLHPVWIIFALLALGSLFGFTGMLLSMPIAVVLSVLARFLTAQYRESSLYLGTQSHKGDS